MPLVFCSQCFCDFKTHHFLPEPSLPWPSVFDHVWIWLLPALVPSAAVALLLPAPHSINTPLLLTFLAEMGDSGEGSMGSLFQSKFNPSSSGRVTQNLLGE